MKRQIVSLILIAAFLLGGVACSQAEAQQAMILGKQDDGKTVKLAPGEEFQIVLEGNPTTGYTWDVEQIDNTVLNLVGEPEFQADSSLLGAGGKMTLRFEGIASGRTSVKLVYHRPWEKGVEPLETFDINVEVSS